MVSAVMAAALMVVGIVEELIPLDLVESNSSGLTRYTNEAMAGKPPVPAIVTIVVLIVLGVCAWRDARWPWLLVGSLLMLVAASVPGVLWLSNAGELVLAASIVATLIAAARPERVLSIGATL